MSPTTMEKLPLPDFSTMDARRREAEDVRQRRAVVAFAKFSSKESKGDDNHPVVLALRALEAGSVTEALAYLKFEIDKAEADGNEDRRGDLMRWKTSLNIERSN